MLIVLGSYALGITMPKLKKIGAINMITDTIEANSFGMYFVNDRYYDDLEDLADRFISDCDFGISDEDANIQLISFILNNPIYGTQETKIHIDAGWMVLTFLVAGLSAKGLLKMSLMMAIMSSCNAQA